MRKPILIFLAAVSGLLGLAMTACGAVFASGGGTNASIAFTIGIVPGLLVLWLAYWLFKRAANTVAPGQPPMPGQPPPAPPPPPPDAGSGN